MTNRKIMIAVLFLFGLTLTTACSKNIMPPEGLTVGNVNGQMNSSKGSVGSQGNSGTSGSGFLIEEDIDSSEARRQHFKETNYIQDIIFKFDRYDLDDESRAVLRNNVTYLKKNSMTAIEIQGHCDERGTNNYNIALGERRAQATKMYMVSQGISASRIHTISYGEEKPFCFDSNDACWLKNRRAHFKVDR